MFLSSQVTYIYIPLFTIQIVSKQLHRDNMKIIQVHRPPESRQMDHTVEY